MTDNKLHLNKNIIEFLAVAHEFCNQIEAFNEEDNNIFVNRMVRLMPLLYLKATLLPIVEPNDDYSMSPVVNQQQYNAIIDKISLILNSYNSNVLLPDSIHNSHEFTQIQLSELFADIYQDLKNFSINYRLGLKEQMEQTLYELKQSFDDYWGIRLLVGMQSLHKLFVNKIDINTVSDEVNDFDYNNVDTSSWIINQSFKDWKNND